MPRFFFSVPVKCHRSENYYSVEATTEEAARELLGRKQGRYLGERILSDEMPNYKRATHIEPKYLPDQLRAESPAMRVVQRFDGYQGHGLGWSRERDSAGRRCMMRLAIAYGLEFFLDDVDEECDEYYYAIACGCERGRGNMSFALAFEQARKRKPFLLRDPGNKTPTRMYVGRHFEWYGCPLECTSINDEKSLFVAVSRRGAKKRRVLRITHADIRECHQVRDLWPAILRRKDALLAVHPRLGARFIDEGNALAGKGQQQHIHLATLQKVDASLRRYEEMAAADGGG